MPNIIAYAVLLLWPLAIVLMFRKLSPERAFIWAILGGYMLLPQATEFNFPMIPPLDKVTLPNLTAYVVCLTILGQRIAILPASVLGRVLLAMLIAAPVLSVFSNSDPITFGAEQTGRLRIVYEDVGQIPGMRIYDSISVLARQVIYLLPFFIARNLLASEAALTEILRALVIAGLIYSVPMLYEIRFSPQLHTHLYGFFQHDFGQMIRQGGFRPIVFMPHGLWVAFFTIMTALSALHFLKHADANARLKWVLIAAYLGVMVVLTKSLGPLIMFVGLTPLVLLFGPMMQLRVAAAMGLIAITYPLLRGADIIPVWRYVTWLEARNPERAQSLGYRFFNEDILLERAWEKAIVGWGGWGRNMLHDPMTGEVITVSDGMWVIVIGQFGWMGYLGTFGLLCLPLFALWWCYRRVPSVQIAPQIGVVALLLGANLIDLLPNATLVPLTWLMAGALLGQAELQRTRNRVTNAAQARKGLDRNGLLAAARPERANAALYRTAAGGPKP